MAVMRVGLNGFGRIGKLIARVMASTPELRRNIQLVAINDPGMTVQDAVRNFKYDSVHGRHPNEVAVENGDKLCIEGLGAIRFESSKETLPWGELGVDMVFEATGIYAKNLWNQKH
ncbi:MAG: glyceraldehyde 3-phosphate dehydrogenase NAD-binding domain-containing protein, partial [Candidatus Margulisiibacteriota bacterium]